MKSRPGHRLQRIAILFGCCLTLYLLFFSKRRDDDNQYRSFKNPPSDLLEKDSDLLEDLSLNEEQCEAQFPSLFKPIRDAVAEGPFEVQQNGGRGRVHGRIQDGRVC